MATAAGLIPGSVVVQRYRLVEPSPTGPVGRSWRAQRLSDGEDALVVALPADAVTPSGARALAHEGASLQGLDHPLLVTPTELGPLPQGGLFAAFPWPGGDTLQARLGRQGALPGAVVVQLGSDLLEALHELHQRGILARSLSPRDVVLVLDDEGRLRAQLVLAGMVAAAGRGEGVEGVGPRGGADELGERIRYAPPEQLRGDGLRTESDVWAVAALLMEALTGSPPFAGDDPAALLAAMTHGLSASLTGHGTPEGMLRVLRQSLETRVEARPPDADAMRFALRASVPAEMAPVATPPRGLRDESRSYVARPVSPPVAPSTAGAGGAGADLDDLDALVASMHAEPQPTFIPSDHPGARGPSLAPRAAPSSPPLPRSSTPAVDSFDLDELPPVEALRPSAPSSPPRPSAPSSPPRASAPSSPPRASAPSSPPRASGASPVVGQWAVVADEPAGGQGAGPVGGLDGRVITRHGGPRPRRVQVSVPVAAAAIFAVTVGLGLAGWELLHTRKRPVAAQVVDAGPTTTTPGPALPAGDGGPMTDAVGAEGPVRPPREENPTPVEFGEQTRIPLPAGLRPEEVSRFLRHVTAGALPEAATVRGFAACVEGRVFLRPAGLSAAVQEVRAPVRCEGQDLALVPDLDGDGKPDAAAVNAQRTGVIVLGSRGGRVLRQVRMPGALGIAAGLRLGTAPTPEPGLVVFVSPGVGGTSLVAVGLRSGRTVWSTPSWVRPGDPVDLGLSVGPDLDGDALPDVVFGLIDRARRCVLAASGSTGEVRWTTPWCQNGLAGQGLALGADIDEDGVADVVVSDAEGGVVRVLSGRSGRELRRIPIELGRGGALSTAMAATQDLTRDGFPAVALAHTTPVGASVEVFSTNDGHRVGAWTARSVGTAPGETALRVVFVESFPFEGARSLLAATPDGVVCLGAGRRADEGLPR